MGEETSKDVKLKQIDSDVSMMVQKVQNFKIQTEKNLIEATDFLAAISTRLKRIEELRLFFTKPLLDQKKKIDEEFKKYIEPLEKLQKDLKGGIILYRQQEEEKIQAQKEKQIEEAKKLKGEEKQKAIEAIETNPELNQKASVVGERGSIRVRKAWDFEILDEKKVPKKYLKVDEVKIREDISKGIRKITGIKIFEKEIISSYN